MLAVIRKVGFVLSLLAVLNAADAAQGWRAIDGDSIVSPAGQVIRIANIDTAELEGQCENERRLARQAKAATQAALDWARTVTLRPYERSRDRYGRTLVYVSVDNRDLGELLMAQGLARPWTGRRQSWCPS
jgi:micrococcal nuclease